MCDLLKKHFNENVFISAFQSALSLRFIFACLS